MIIAEYEGYGLSFKSVWKNIQREATKGIKKITRVAIPLYLGKKLGLPEEELKQALVMKELERQRKIQIPAEQPVPAEQPEQMTVTQPQPADTMRQIMPYLILGIPMVVSLIFILRRR